MNLWNFFRKIINPLFKTDVMIIDGFFDDKKSNSQSTPPDKEKINLSALWLFEVFTPGNIKNLFGVCTLFRVNKN
jgi:hypothetical protein